MRTEQFGLSVMTHQPLVTLSANTLSSGAMFTSDAKKRPLESEWEGSSRVPECRQLFKIALGWEAEERGSHWRFMWHQKKKKKGFMRL